MKLKLSFLLLCLLMVGSNDIYGQRDEGKGARMSSGFDYSTVYSLKSVTFWEPSGLTGYLGWIQIMSDFDPNTAISGSTSTLAWENGAKVKPIAYVSDYHPRLEAEFTITCSSGNASQYFAKATHSSGYNFPPKQLTVNNGKYKYPKTNCDKKFDKEVVRYWEDFELEWHISDNANGPWIPVGNSKNYMYVTHKAPIIGITAPGHISPTNAQHTLIHLGCLNANGQSIAANIVDDIYNEFTDRDVRRFDGAGPIKYWGSSSTLCRDVPTMLKNLDGVCQGWASFFEDLIRLQGIATAEMSTVTYNQYVLNALDLAKVNMDAMTFFGSQISNLKALPPDFPQFSGIRSDFFVNSWNVTSNSKFVINEYNNIFYGITPINITLANGNTIPISAQSGAAAQGNNDPRSEFENHAITKYNGKYYDPSYGSPIANSANDWETPALSSFGSIMVYTYNGRDYYVNWIGHLNDNTLQSLITP